MAKKEKEVVEETPKEVKVEVKTETVDPEVPENKQRWLR